MKERIHADSHQSNAKKGCGAICSPTVHTGSKENEPLRISAFHFRYK